MGYHEIENAHMYKSGVVSVAPAATRVGNLLPVSLAQR